MCRHSLLAVATAAILVVFVVPAFADTPRIVNGLPTQNRATTGALLDTPFSNEFHGSCSGTLVGCQYFLTAAHCVCIGDDFATCGTPNPADFTVYLQHGGIVGVSAIVVNPGFEFSTAGDVAVLTLAAPVTRIHPTQLNVGNPSFGTAADIAGFGVTAGFRNDFGLLREGKVVINSCSGASIPDDGTHVCWDFDDPIGPAGIDSSGCFGDSGGPLFITATGKIAGATSGGVADDCLTPDTAFDANVSDSAAFINGIIGAYPANCGGAVAHIGDGGAVVTTVRGGLGSSGRACRKLVRSYYSSYTSGKLKLMQKCIDGVNKGTIVGTCPDMPTVDKIAKLNAKVDAAKLAAKCPTEVVPTIFLAGSCAAATDGASLRTCILAAGDARVTALLDAEYANANPGAPNGNPDLVACQVAIQKATSKYGIGRLKLLTNCQAKEDKGQRASCPDQATTDKIANKLVPKVQPAIENKCTGANLAALNAMSAFGGGCNVAAAGMNTAGFATCEITAHNAQGDALIGNLQATGPKSHPSFNVPAGTVRLRVTLNAVEASANDFDLYIRQGTPPTIAVFDAKSDNYGVWESIELVPPSPTGTWYALVAPFAGDASAPFQLTITAFNP